MNLEEQPASQQEQSLSRYAIWFWLAPLLPLLILVLYFAFSGPSAPTTSQSSGAGLATESGLDTARQGLTRQTDLDTCRNALGQINAELGEKPALRPPSLTEEQKSWLHDNLNLSDDELKEVESSNYTRLDHQHLFRCFLMRDAASALEVKGVRGKAGGQPVREKPLDQAARAFAWVMRQVRLHQHKGDEVPPSFVVRRGWGTALERSLVFLALLEQLGDPNALQPELFGFLLQIPNASGGVRLWACGVVIGDGKEVYLFDPHLGLPLPGPKGEGIATLAQAREQPDVLSQLNVGAKIHYPVTAEQARGPGATVLSAFDLVAAHALSPGKTVRSRGARSPGSRCRDGSGAREDRLLGRVEEAGLGDRFQRPLYFAASLSAGGPGRRG